MRKIWILALPAAIALPQRAASQPRAGAPDTTTRMVDRVFDAWRGTERPGCAVGVSRNGRAVYEQDYGMANLETTTPIRPASIFHVASISKQFTAMAIMLLARDGALSIDDNIRKYLPEIPDYGTPITIRHLLTHTSGLRDQWDLIGLARGRFEENRITEADVMDIVPRQKALNFTPGAEYLYSNTGFTLLGVIVKRVSGKSLRAYADEKIFKPLGMANTHFHDDYTMLVPGRTSAYAPVPGGWRVSIPNFDTYGATSLFTTVGDLLRWEANFDAPVVGDRTIFDQMQTRARLTNGDTVTYGLGLTVERYRSVRMIGHGGADAGYRSYVTRFPEQGVAIAIACNAATANTTVLARGVADAYLGGALAPIDSFPMPQAVAVSAPMLQRRAGTYLQPTTLQVLELAMRDGRLSVGRTTGPVLVPLAENRFRVTGQPVEYLFADGEHPRLEQRALAGGRPVPFEWHTPTVLAPGSLNAYVGDYYSEELDARYRVAATDSTLLLRTGTSNPVTARAVFADTFLGGGYTIQFMRNGAQVTGFEVTNGRIRRVRFARVASAR
jgi:CubicO group peptidase (beta-lactamase class C family)